MAKVSAAKAGEIETAVRAWADNLARHPHISRNTEAYNLVRESAADLIKELGGILGADLPAESGTE